MAVFFAIGGGAVVTIGAAILHSDHSRHSEYDRYGDAEVRRAKRENSENSIRSEVKSLATKKRQDINPKLTDPNLINQSAMRVELPAMDKNAQEAISSEQKKEHRAKLASLEMEISEIDDILQKIENLQKQK